MGQISSVRGRLVRAGFDFGSWRNGRIQLNPGEGAFLASREEQELVFSGLVPRQTGEVKLEGGWNMVSVPFREILDLPEPLMGDAVYQFEPRKGIYHMTDPMMDPQPNIQPGESFWYFRNEPGAEPPREGTVLFHNYFFGTGSRLLIGGCPVSDPNWLVQLVAGADPNSLAPVGEPLRFLPGEGAGYIDVSPGAVRYIPNVEPGKTAFLALRAWDTRPGLTWQEATIRIMSQVVSVTSGGSGGPPILPAGIWDMGLTLGGLFDFSPFSIRLLTQSQYLSPGEAARFEAQVFYSVAPLGFQWQKQNLSGNWIDIPGATSTELVMDPVTVEVVEWHPFFTSLGFEGQLEIKDRLSHSHNMRFYRARMVNP